MDSTLPDPADPAQRVQQLWNRLAQTQWRDYFIASLPGWDEKGIWSTQAEIDVHGYLTGIDRERLATAHVLEIGCGVGRLAPLFAKLAATYTGIDISREMLAEARRRTAQIPNVRLFESSGAAVPAGARDRRYHLVVAVAVFIHCPKELVTRMLRDAYELVAPGGAVRAQLRVDIHDPEQPTCDLDALEPGSAARAVAAGPTPELPHPPAKPVDLGAIELGQHPDYAGHPFRIAEARELAAICAPGARAQLYRPAQDLLYLLIAKPR